MNGESGAAHGKARQAYLALLASLSCEGQGSSFGRTLPARTGLEKDVITPEVTQLWSHHTV